MINSPGIIVFTHHRPCLFASSIEEDSKDSIATAVLTIKSVSNHDLSSEFTCFGKSLNDKKNKTVTLVRRGQFWVTAALEITEAVNSFELLLTFISLCTQSLTSALQYG